MIKNILFLVMNAVGGSDHIWR